jgi:hypothetical protein
MSLLDQVQDSNQIYQLPQVIFSTHFKFLPIAALLLDRLDLGVARIFPHPAFNFNFSLTIQPLIKLLN